MGWRRFYSSDSDFYCPRNNYTQPWTERTDLAWRLDEPPALSAQLHGSSTSRGRLPAGRRLFREPGGCVLRRLGGMGVSGLGAVAGAGGSAE